VTDTVGCAEALPAQREGAPLDVQARVALHPYRMAAFRAGGFVRPARAGVRRDEKTPTQ
jgi:hypothetical protein